MLSNHHQKFRMNILNLLKVNMARGELYEDERELAVKVESLIRCIAFYLPQFHPIAENDAWWGKGFTEWTNVTRSIPRFSEHYQPRLPGEMGFYDLRNPDILRRQAQLARQYGLHGFCFHHYWFNGKRLLEKPIEMLLSDTSIDLPFCVNWANENWTRRWDGHDEEVLLAQNHSPEDDLAFARSLEPLFRDPRYIRIGGRPLLMLYRPAILPNAAETVLRWREHFIDAGLGNPYLVMAQVRNDGDPKKYGMDAVAGFPPFWTGSALPRLQSSVELLDPNFKGEIVDYEAMAMATVDSYQTDVKLFPGVCPGWDNEARRPGKGFCFVGSTPEKYGRWLQAACNHALAAEDPDERIVFINAWNEWAEGAYLEPDRHFGYAYLAETARVLSRALLHRPTPGNKKQASTNLARQSPKVGWSPNLGMRRRAKKLVNKVANVSENFANYLRS
jgi:lipopolysaccharide biosynthesis protein